MKIALIGYGRMGKEIEHVAMLRNHEVVLRINEKTQHDFTVENLKKADVAIEFTTPNCAVDNILKCFEASVPVVAGTTGWLEWMEEIKRICIERNQALFYAANYSLGVNLFIKLNEYLAGLMKNYPAYFTSIEEVHHVHKKDIPSGTAIVLAEGILKENKGIKKWVSGAISNEDELPVDSVRVGEVPGTHTIYYTSEADEIRIAHEAYSRRGFAEGAVHAAEWMMGKKGVFGMKDLMEL